jgi:CBS domain-containing protein
MITCPYCDHENIDGSDHCEACENSLSEMDIPVPASELERSLLRDRVGKLISRRPWTVEPSTPLGEVLRRMHENSVGCAIVMDQGRLVGVFSERDALLRVGTEVASLASAPISQFMTTKVQTLHPDAKVAFAVQRMDLGGFRHVPIVTTAMKPVGVISVRDILRYLTGKLVS